MAEFVRFWHEKTAKARGVKPEPWPLLGCIPPVRRRRVLEEPVLYYRGSCGRLTRPSRQGALENSRLGLRSESRPHLLGQLLCPLIGYHRVPNVLRGAGLLGWSVDLPVDVLADLEAHGILEADKEAGLGDAVGSHCAVQQKISKRSGG